MIAALIIIWAMLGFALSTFIHSTILDNLFSTKACIGLLLCGPVAWLVLIAAALAYVIGKLLASLAEVIQDWIEN